MSATKLNRIDTSALIGNPRATYAAWQRCESVVSSARELHPRTYSFVPAGSLTSTMSKLRDAIRGAIAFAYVTDPQALARWYSEIVIRTDGEYIFLGPPEDKNPKPLGVKDVPLTFDSLTTAELDAFALLISNQRIVGPVVLQNAERFANYNSSQPNCIAIYREGTLTLL